MYLLFLTKTSVNSDATSGKEMSDGYEGTHGGKGEAKVRKHHRRSTRTRSRQEKINRPKLNMLNVGNQNIFQQRTYFFHPMLKKNLIVDDVFIVSALVAGV